MGRHRKSESYNPQLIIEQLEEEGLTVKQLLSKVEKELSKLPEGKIHTSKRNHGFVYWKYLNSKRTFLPQTKNRREIELLCQKDYFSQLAEYLTKKEQVLTAAIQSLNSDMPVLSESKTTLSL